MKRQEWWQEQYRADAYMAHLADDALRGRLDDVIANCCIVTDDLKLGLLSSAVKVPEATDFWGIAFTHLLEEFGSRGSGLPVPVKRWYASLDWPNLQSAVLPFQLSKQTHPQVLVKYGNANHLKGAMNTGGLLIKPASSYDDPSLNSAMRDDELELVVYRRSKLYTLLIDKYGNALKPIGPVHGVKQEVLRSPTNYYVYCMSMLRSLRMFGDFEYDAALVIHDIRKFVRQLGEQVRAHLGPGWSWSARPVKYIDPLRTQPDHLNVIECKHFAYAYQHEYRLIWVPDKPTAKLEPLFINVGPLRDYSQCIELTADKNHAS
jgi:hypothetical protein